MAVPYLIRESIWREYPLKPKNVKFLKEFFYYVKYSKNLVFLSKDWLKNPKIYS